MPADFEAFFRAATSLRRTGEATATQAGNTPYDYQRRLACGEQISSEPVERGRTAGAKSMEGEAPAVSRVESLLPSRSSGNRA